MHFDFYKYLKFTKKKKQRLHQLFIEHIIEQEQKEYLSESIPWAEIPTANKETIEILEGRKNMTGIFGIIDDSCNQRTNNETQLLSQMKQTYTGLKNFEVPKIGNNNKFCLKHYAEDVVYDLTEFKQKNMGFVPDVLLSLISNSSSCFVRNLNNPFCVVPHPPPNSSISSSPRRAQPPKKPQTVSGFFRVIFYVIISFDYSLHFINFLFNFLFIFLYFSLFLFFFLFIFFLFIFYFY